MFYDKYAQLCKKRDISNSAAAHEAGISKSLVSKWKKDRTETPSPEVLEKLSAYFGVPISELLEEDVDIKKEQAINFDGLSADRIALIEFAMSVPEHKVKQVHRLMESILKNV